MSHDAQAVDRKRCESSETVQNEKEYETEIVSVSMQRQWRIQRWVGGHGGWRPENFFRQYINIIIEGFYFPTGLCLPPFAVFVLCIACRLQQQVL